MTETDLSTWLTIAEAATALRCGKRTVERLAADKKLDQRLRPQRGSPDVAVFSPQSVAEEAARRHPAPPAFVVGRVPTNGNNHGQASIKNIGPTDISHSLTAPDDDPIRRLFAAALRAVLSPPSPPVAVTMAETLSPEERAAQYVTLAEASAIKHLSQAYLRRQVEAGALKAIRDRGWRIRRKDLEQL